MKIRITEDQKRAWLPGLADGSFSKQKLPFGALHGPEMRFNLSHVILRPEIRSRTSGLRGFVA